MFSSSEIMLAIVTKSIENLIAPLSVVDTSSKLRGLAEDDVATTSVSPDVAAVRIATIGCPRRRAPVASPPLLLVVPPPPCLRAIHRPPPRLLLRRSSLHLSLSHNLSLGGSPLALFAPLSAVDTSSKLRGLAEENVATTSASPDVAAVRTAVLQSPHRRCCWLYRHCRASAPSVVRRCGCSFARAPFTSRDALDRDEDDEVTPNDVFIHVYTKYHDRVTFINNRSTRFPTKLMRRREEHTQATSNRPINEKQIYYDVAGVCSKGCVYGLGSLAKRKRRYEDPSASTSQEPMVRRLELDAVVHMLAQFEAFMQRQLGKRMDFRASTYQAPPPQLPPQKHHQQGVVDDDDDEDNHDLFNEEHLGDES
ncbi:hypothetical protein Syun_001690 [Stephania yunnanensis]|uniref:Uncharacterized protein n=1 Tax=Stephania yunnanensis TaxID=152371 RepID=A0AAP0LF83_9MAGN